MSNRVAINAKTTRMDGDNSDISSPEVPAGQVVPKGSLSTRDSIAIDADSSGSPSSPVSHPYLSKTSPIPRPRAPIPWRFGPPPPYGPSVSNTHDFASVSVPAALTRDPTRKSPHWACTQLAQRENLQKSAAKVPRNTTPKLRPSADRVSKAIDLNTRSLVRLVSPQAGGLIDRLLIEHDRALARRRNGSEVPAINEYASKLMLETAFKELKVPICRLSTIGRALKDFYTQSGISDEAKRSEPLLLNIKDLLDRIEQTLLLFADIDQIELALAGLRLKRVGLGNTDPKGNADPKGNCDPKGNAEPKGNADPNPAQGQSRQSHAYIGRSFTQLGPDTPPPGRGLLHLPDEID